MGCLGGLGGPSGGNLDCGARGSAAWDPGVEVRGPRRSGVHGPGEVGVPGEVQGPATRGRGGEFLARSGPLLGTPPPGPRGPLPSCPKQLRGARLSENSERRNSAQGAPRWPQYGQQGSQDAPRRLQEVPQEGHGLPSLPGSVNVLHICFLRLNSIQDTPGGPSYRPKTTQKAPNRAFQTLNGRPRRPAPFL